MATNVDAKLLKQTKFPPEFSQKVDMKKVNVEPDIKVLQIQLTGFLDKDTPKFCKELWTLCLSAQSNPQGVPKELLEAKKLELIQEKVRLGFRLFQSPNANQLLRLTLRKLLKRLKNARNKNGLARETLTTSGRESGLTVDGVVEEATEHIMTTIGALQELQGLHLLAVALHRTEKTTAGLHAVISWIRIFLVTEATEEGDAIRADGGHRPRVGRLAGDAALVQADRQRRSVEAVIWIDGIELLLDGMIELDPTLVQTHLARDPPDDPKESAALRSHPAVLRPLQSHDMESIGMSHCRRLRSLGPVPFRWAEIEGAMADREDLRPTLVMT
ncbi:MAG: hypothetical protein Q9184_001950 [Pyrenodesmia sp. 2 TL-2023]